MAEGQGLTSTHHAAEGLEAEDNVAEVEEEWEGALTPVLGLVYVAKASALGVPQFTVTDVTSPRQPQPNVAQGPGCGQGASIGDRGGLRGG